jgi:hypothetical protein
VVNKSAGCRWRMETSLPVKFGTRERRVFSVYYKWESLFQSPNQCNLNSSGPKRDNFLKVLFILTRLHEPVLRKWWNVLAEYEFIHFNTGKMDTQQILVVYMNVSCIHIIDSIIILHGGFITQILEAVVHQNPKDVNRFNFPRCCVPMFF